MLIVRDRVREQTLTEGSGPIVLNGPDSTFLSFSSVCSNGDTFFYAVVHKSADEWEIGLGAFQTNTIERTQILSSSNAGNIVVFSQGGKDVFITQPATTLDVLTRTSAPVLLGNDSNQPGLVKQLSVQDIKSMLALTLADIQGTISTEPNNRASYVSGVYVPEMNLDLVQIYTNNKQ